MREKRMNTLNDLECQAREIGRQWDNPVTYIPDNIPTCTGYRQDAKGRETPCWTDFGGYVPDPPTKKKKKENAMQSAAYLTVNTPPVKTEVQEQWDYLANRLYQAQLDRHTKAGRKFGLTDDGAPQTPQEIVDRFASGKFMLPAKKDENYGFWGSFEHIRWRDPAVKEDSAGYKVWSEADEVAFTEAMDQIRISSPAEGLKALKAYEASA
jgi:hypothetical protein